MRRLARASFAGSTDGTGSRRGHFRRAFAAFAGTGGLALVLALLVTPAASAAPWGFEQVSPPSKGPGAVMASDTFRPSQDGDSFLYSASAPFDGVPTEASPGYTRYIGHRGADSWLNRALDPPFGDVAAFYSIMAVVGSSADLSHVMVASTTALTPGAIEDGGNLYMRDTRTGALTLIAADPDPDFVRVITGLSGATNIKFVANDGRSALFSTQTPLVPGAPGGFAQEVLYSWTADGGVEAASVLPANEGGAIVSGGITAGSEAAGPRRSLPEGDGLAHVYFWARIEFTVGPTYVRSNGVTKAISYSRIPGDPTTPVPAMPDAVGTDGRFAVFTTVQGARKLTPDTPEAPFQPSRYYRYDANDDSLTYIGRKGEGLATGIVQMSQDGQTVVFQSTAAQTPGAVEGQVNTYLWRDGSLQLVATSDPGSTGASTSEALRVLSGNGRYYSFSDNSSTLAAQFGVTDNTSSNCPGMFTPTGPCDEMYLYDAETEELSCSSCVPGQAPRGHAGDRLGTYTRMDSHQMQTVANDGTVFFTTPEQLVPADNNNLRDAYAVKDGEWRLLSRAAQGASSRFLDATDDGKTVFISTSDAIVPTDTDNAVDVYMTREGAGYPYTPPVAPPVCAGIESCHAGVPATPTQSSAGSSAFEGRGNEKPRSRKGGDKVTVVKPRPATGSQGSVKVKAPGKGKLTVSGAGVKKASKSVSKAGTYTLKVTLTPQAAKALEKSGQTQKTLKVSFKPSQGKASSTTVKLTFKASAGKKGGR